jgi:hypothetical protein
MKILLKQPTNTIFRLTEDGEFACAHEEAYIVEACCSPFQVGESGYVECGCGGMDSVVCPAADCTGIQNFEIEELFERIESE